MSIDAYKWAKQQNDLPALEKWLLVTIADFYNEEQKRAWPGREALARQTCMSVRSISRHIAGLEKAGLIIVERWYNNDNGKNLSNRYYLPKYDPESGRKCKPNRTVIAAVVHDPKSGRVSFDDFS